jgi:H+/Cl- antiporter ClcA
MEPSCIGERDGKLCLIGSASLLAAATLGPLSSAVFLLELTRRADSLMVPLLIAVAGAMVTARAWESRSIHSIAIKLDQAYGTQAHGMQVHPTSQTAAAALRDL